MRYCDVLVHASIAMKSGGDSKRGICAPIELDMEASDSKLEGMKILERVESQPSDRGSTGQSLEQFCQRIGNIRLCSTGINCNGHVLLSLTKQCEFGRTIDGKANQKFTGT
jgi:hypothetical protein